MLSDHVECYVYAAGIQRVNWKVFTRYLLFILRYRVMLLVVVRVCVLRVSLNQVLMNSSGF